MKKLGQLLCSLVMVISFTPAFSLAVSPPLMDYADLLSDGQEASLVMDLNTVSETLGISVGVILYDQNISYGNLLSYVKGNDGPTHFGSNRILMCMNLQSREMVIEASGKGNAALDDWDNDLILDEVAPYFSAENYAQGLELYLTLTESMVLGIETEAEQAREKEEKMEALLPIALGGFVLALIVSIGGTMMMVSAMNNVKEQKHASNYVKQGSFHLRSDRESFLYRRVTKTPRQQNNGAGRSGGGGGGRGSHSGGRSRGF